MTEVQFLVGAMRGPLSFTTLSRLALGST